MSEKAIGKLREDNFLNLQRVGEISDEFSDPPARPIFGKNTRFYHSVTIYDYLHRTCLRNAQLAFPCNYTASSAKRYNVGGLKVRQRTRTLRKIHRNEPSRLRRWHVYRDTVDYRITRHPRRHLGRVANADDATRGPRTRYPIVIQAVSEPVVRDRISQMSARSAPRKEAARVVGKTSRARSPRSDYPDPT